MSGKWTPAQLEQLFKIHQNKPAWMTDNELAGRVVGQFKKSKESIRWQLRQFPVNIPKKSFPKILLLDIETLPIEALVWGTWKQSIYMDQIKKDWSVLCWAAKWLFDTDVMGRVVTPEEAVAHEDASVLEPMWNLMNEADIIITHNGDDFDIKKLNARFLLHGYPPPMYSKSIDTKKIAKNHFAFTYNKLDWIAQILGVGRKIETEFEWWKECEAGNKKYLDMMLKYNKQDVHVEEEVYLKLRPWMKGHPNMAVFSVNEDVAQCPACGSLDISFTGKYQTPLGLYLAFRCQGCGAIGRVTKKEFKIGKAISQG